MILYLFALKRPFSGAAMRRLANIQLTRNAVPQAWRENCVKKRKAF
jgi:hypothetical protein